MKFSFRKAPNKAKPKASTPNAFHLASNHQLESASTITHTSDQQQQHHDIEHTDHKLDNVCEVPTTTTDDDPCALFNRYYDEALCHAENKQFSDSLRCFDVAIRFWNVYALQLQEMYPCEYAQFAFPDINTCEASKYFLNELKNNKSHAKTTKKALWKPPPTHQPSVQTTSMTTNINIMDEQNMDSNVVKVKHNAQDDQNDDDDAEVIFFDDDDDDDEHLKTKHIQESIEAITIGDSTQKYTDIETWKTLIFQHRKIGSKMFEYQAQILLEFDRDFEAIKACQSCILLNASNAINWLTLARAELNFGDPFQALQSISKAVELDFENDEIIEQYAATHAICETLKKHTHTQCEHGANESNILCRRLVEKSHLHNLNECMQESKAVQQRLEKRQSTKQMDVKSKLNRKNEVMQIVDDYHNIMMMRMTDTLNVDVNLKEKQI
mmetsp:Transcript_34076/g.55550  ORF Transcript_34076/g.55550 Transcript_34076/m.55550 type:complete len:439 (+) Transcript_34076:17-1333(+)